MPLGHIRLRCNEPLWVRFRCDATRRPIVVVSGVVMWGTPAGVIQALGEQGGMFITPCNGHVDQDMVVPSAPTRSASRMMVSQSGQLPPSPTERPYRWAVRPAPLAEEALATTRTVVDRVCHEQWLALELLAHDDRIRSGQRLVTQSIGELLVGRLAIHGAAAR